MLVLNCRRTILLLTTLTCSFTLTMAETSASGTPNTIRATTITYPDSRVITYDYGSSADVDRIKYGYDRSGNRLWRENVVARSLSKEFDELYTYDAVHRLKDMSRGTLDSGHTALTSTTFAQCWGLDETGNWSNFREDDDGNGSWSLNQNRTTNQVNEITNVTESTGPSWITPAYSAAGNMATVPKPADPTTSFTATYDAWNRLVKLVDTSSSDTVAEYEYDGAKRRFIQKSYIDGSLDESRHLFYTEPLKWQIVEERVDSSTDSERQFVWGLRYIDDLVLRDRDTTGNGTLNERYYALQDANWNITATANTSGTVRQRIAYHAYGTPEFLTSSFVVSANFDDWETLSAGYRIDPRTGVFHVRFRVLNSTIGVWLERDPFGLHAGTNSFEVVGGEPLGQTDPLGLVNAPPGADATSDECNIWRGDCQADCINEGTLLGMITPDAVRCMDSCDQVANRCVDRAADRELTTHLDNSCCNLLTTDVERSACHNEVLSLVAAIQDARKWIDRHGGASNFTFSGKVCTQCEDHLQSIVPQSNRYLIYTTTGRDTPPPTSHQWGIIGCASSGKIVATIDHWCGQMMQQRVYWKQGNTRLGPYVPNFGNSDWPWENPASGWPYRPNAR